MVRELVDEVIFNSPRGQGSFEDLVQRYSAIEAAPKPKAPRKKADKVEIEDLDCPKCKAHKLKRGNTAYGCGNFKQCGFLIPFVLMDKKLTDAQITQLITKGKTGAIKGFKLPDGTEKQGKLVVDTDFNITLE